MGIGTWEVVVIVLVILLLFGGRKIPELMKGLGVGMREFKKGMRGEDDDSKQVSNRDKTDTNKT